MRYLFNIVAVVVTTGMVLLATITPTIDSEERLFFAEVQCEIEETESSEGKRTILGSSFLDGINGYTRAVDIDALRSHGIRPFRNSFNLVCRTSSVQLRL